MEKRSKLIDFDEDFSVIDNCMNETNLKTDRLDEALDANSDNLDDLEKEMEALTRRMNLSIVQGLNAPTKEPSTHEIDLELDKLFLNHHLLVARLEPTIQEKLEKNPEILPKLDGVDMAVAGLAGIVASIVDLLIVKIPKEMNYLGKYQQSGSETTTWLKSLGVDENGELNGFFKWLEDHAKVSFDQSINTGNLRNFFPGNHRMLSLGHDPFFGLIFGTLDILRGQMTVIDGEGTLHMVKTFNMPTGDKIFAPIVWLTHIVSDICSRQGIPIPGWGFTQLLQIGSFGQKERTIADLTRWMYEQGYDLRHLVTMSTAPASIEIIVRLYHHLSLDLPLTRTHDQSLADYELTKVQRDLKLHKMLFASHSIASIGNFAKVFFMAGNPTALNVAQWGMLLRESLVVSKAFTREKDVEKIMRNRQDINVKWKKLS